FYEYGSNGKRTRLWPGFLDYGKGKWKADGEGNELKPRMLTIQALDAARCFVEGVITEPRDADVGAILGWGFAPYNGGTISMNDTIGAADFLLRCEELADQYGKRFQPNKLLEEMAAGGETFYGRFGARAAA